MEKEKLWSVEYIRMNGSSGVVYVRANNADHAKKKSYGLGSGDVFKYLEPIEQVEK